MGVDVGFSFYRVVESNPETKVVKLEPVKLIKDCNNEMSHYTFVCGRCQATSYFTDWVERRYHDCDDKTYPEVIINDKNLDGYIKENIKEKYFSDSYAKAKLFYQSLEDLENYLNFEQVEKEHQDYINDSINTLLGYDNEIDKIRECQAKAQTSAAFNGFQKQIDKIKENIEEEKEQLKYLQEEDYDYNHYMWVKDEIENVKKIMKDNPDIIVTAWCSY